MKKSLLIAILALSTSSVFAQGKYISVGTSYSENLLTYGVEVGVWNDKAWFGVLAETTGSYQIPYKNKQYTTYVGGKVYVKAFSLGKKTDFYGFGAMKVGLVEDMPLQFEGGVSTVFNLSDKWAIQYNMSLPKYEGITVTNPSVGLSLNYYF